MVVQAKVGGSSRFCTRRPTTTPKIKIEIKTTARPVQSVIPIQLNIRKPSSQEPPRSPHEPRQRRHQTSKRAETGSSGGLSLRSRPDPRETEQRFGFEVSGRSSTAHLNPIDVAQPGPGAQFSASQMFQLTAHLKHVSHRSLWTSRRPLCWSSIPGCGSSLTGAVINRHPPRHGRHAIWQSEKKTVRLDEPIVAISVASSRMIVNQS
jgi:hypothetical protein